MSFLDRLFTRQSLTTLDIGFPTISADCELNAPTGVGISDIEHLEQLLIGVKTHSGQVVTPERARRCSGVLACMRIIGEDLSSLPVVLYKRDNKTGYSERAVDHNLYRILDMAPNEVMTSMEVREHMIFDLMLWGHFYNLKNEDPANPGDIESIWPLQAGYVVRRWRELIWTYTDPLTGVSGEFDNNAVWRGTIMSPNGLDGTALTLLAREAIGLLLAAEEQGARLFKYGVQTDLALTTDGELGPEGRNQLREAFMQRHAGSTNAFMPLIFEGGLDAKRIGLTAQESQYIEARKFQIEDIARIWRVPEVLLGNSTSGKSSTYASAEQFFQSYTKHTLGPWATRIEQTIHRDLLLPREQSKYFVKHDFSSLLRADTAGRYASYATGIDKGFITPGYAARQENLPWTEELEYYNKPAPPAPGPGPEDAKDAPTDNSASLSRRVALHIMDKERKALIAQKQDVEVFYTHFAGFVEDLTGADPVDVLIYLDSRRKDSDRFSLGSMGVAIDLIIGLCQKDI